MEDSMVSKLFIGTAVVTSALALCACEQRDTTVTRNGDERVATAPAEPATDASRAPASTESGKAELNTETRDYVQKAAMGDMFEVETSRLALSRSASAEIKKI